MSIVLLFIAALFALGAAIGFDEKIYAPATVTTLLGTGYFFWGVHLTTGVPDELVSQNDMTWIYTGLGLVGFGITLFALGWLTHVRTSMPRR